MLDMQIYNSVISK